MPTHNGNPVFRGANGAGAGRGDDANGVTRINRYSAATRKAEPISSEEQTAARARGEYPKVSSGSQASVDVSNAGSHGPGEGMSMVRSKYREQRQSGMAPDDARSAALSPYSYPAGNGPGGKMGPTITDATNAYGREY
jgi:hypothetical protein